MTGWLGQGLRPLLGTFTAKSSVSSKQEKSQRKNAYVRELVFTGMALMDWGWGHRGDLPGAEPWRVRPPTAHPGWEGGAPGELGREPGLGGRRGHCEPQKPHPRRELQCHRPRGLRAESDLMSPVQSASETRRDVLSCRCHLQGREARTLPKMPGRQEPHKRTTLLSLWTIGYSCPTPGPCGIMNLDLLGAQQGCTGVAWMITVASREPIHPELPGHTILVPGACFCINTRILVSMSPLTPD